jgi:hypothetical protein
MVGGHCCCGWWLVVVLLLVVLLLVSLLYWQRAPQSSTPSCSPLARWEGCFQILIVTGGRVDWDLPMCSYVCAIACVVLVETVQPHGAPWQEPYASPILDTLDPGQTMLRGRRYRHHCRRVTSPSGRSQFLKDLTEIVGAAELVSKWIRYCRSTAKECVLSGALSCGLVAVAQGRCVLVDNNPLSFVCQPENGVPVPDFVGQPDDVLAGVLKVLRQLDALPGDGDVRPALREMYSLPNKLAHVAEQLLPSQTPRSKL